MKYNLPLLLALGQALVVMARESMPSFSPVVQHKSFTTQVTSLTKSRIHSLTKSRPVDVAKQFVNTQLNFKPKDYIVKDVTRSDNTGVTHVYLRQKVDNKEIFNANINLNISPDGQVISFGDSFYRSKSKSLKPTSFPKTFTPATESVVALLNHLKIPMGQEPILEKPTDFDSDSGLKLTNVPEAVSDVRAEQGWIQLSNGNLEPVWDFKLELKDDYYHGHVSAITNKPISLVNWASKAAYRVIPFGTNDPLEGDRELIIDPADKIVSPKGWHDLEGEQVNSTAGNNVFAVNATAGDPTELTPEVRVQGGANQTFDFPFDYTKDEPKDYQEAAVTNLFYYSNMLHDLYARFGFDEEAGNFQQVNYNNVGLGNDSVIASAQEASDFNNARFFSPPDGEHGRMLMYLFDQTTPMRDGDFDSGVMIHEYTHGLSIRLTGGPKNSDCLDSGEGAGMGEGWGDAIATMVRMKKNDTRETDKGMGLFPMNIETIRHYLFSTNLTTNPLTYEYLSHEDFGDEHSSGEIWASILYEIYWNLRDKLGVTDDWIGEGASNQSKYGNTLLLRLIVDGLKLQPCNPTFIDARDAIIQAEKLLTKGEHACELWKGFAKRGLGFNAKKGVEVEDEFIKSFTNSFDLPEGCSK